MITQKGWIIFYVECTKTLVDAKEDGVVIRVGYKFRIGFEDIFRIVFWIVFGVSVA